MSKKSYLFLAIIFLLASFAYFFTWIPRSLVKYPGLLSTEIITNITLTKLQYFLVIIVAISLIVTSSLSFQTISESKILTPNILGFDSLFVAIQTSIVASLGTNNIFYSNPYYNFLLNTVLMSCFSIALFKFILKKGNKEIYILLMVGIVLGILFRSLSSFLQVLMSPANFDAVQTSTTASIKSINLNLFYIALPLFIFIMYCFCKKTKEYDVLSLGKENAINLGIDYDKSLNRTLLLISISTSLSTALIGPFTFLGLLAVNLAREISHTYKHSTLIFMSSIIAIIFVLIGQVLVEEFIIIPNLQSVISLVGGLYIIRIILKESKI